MDVAAGTRDVDRLAAGIGEVQPAAAAHHWCVCCCCTAIDMSLLLLMQAVLLLSRVSQCRGCSLFSMVWCRCCTDGGRSSCSLGLCISCMVPAELLHTSGIPASPPAAIAAMLVSSPLLVVALLGWCCWGCPNPGTDCWGLGCWWCSGLGGGCRDATCGTCPNMAPSVA